MKDSARRRAVARARDTTARLSDLAALAEEIEQRADASGARVSLRAASALYRPMVNTSCRPFTRY